MTNSTAERIKGIVASSDVVLFMKGVPDGAANAAFPQPWCKS